MNKECFDEIKLQNKEENSDNDELNYFNFDEFFPRVFPKNVKKKEPIMNMTIIQMNLKSFGNLLILSRL